MNDSKNEVWITGVGVISCFGEGIAPHWETLGAETAPEPVIDAERFAPYAVHPLPEMDWTRQMPRKDMRQMETWQRLGTYAAGLALEDAGMKEDEELVSTMDLVVCAGGGERDISVDESILAEARGRNDREMLLNEKLPYDLRPTLFLAQLSNLMAGNISIVHKVTGSSRTYMGEEASGITALQNAAARIAAGQSTHLLVGGAYNAERVDLLLSCDLGHYLAKDGVKPVAERQKDGGGTVLGSAGAFLVLESAEHAKKRGAKPYARLAGIESGLGSRDNQETRERLDGIMERLGVSPSSTTAVLSGATGCADVTDLEFEALRRRLGMDVAIRSYTTMIGNPIEANFPFGVALGAAALKNKSFYPSFEEAEKPVKVPPTTVVVSTVGHYLGEGMAVLEQIA